MAKAARVAADEAAVKAAAINPAPSLPATVSAQVVDIKNRTWLDNAALTGLVLNVERR